MRHLVQLREWVCVLSSQIKQHCDVQILMLSPADAIRIMVSSFLINDNDTNQILWIKEREGIKHTIESRGYMKSRQKLTFLSWSSPSVNPLEVWRSRTCISPYSEYLNVVNSSLTKCPVFLIFPNIAFFNVILFAITWNYDNL